MKLLILKDKQKGTARKATTLAPRYLQLIHCFQNLSMDQISGLLQGSPDLFPGWREIMEEYYYQILGVGRKVVNLLALALNLECRFFEKPGMMDSPMAFLRLLHYSGEVSDPSTGIYGAGAHSDYGMITMLITNGVPGLQICRQKDCKPQVWEDVEPIKGALIVNLGDMLERWSNGIFRSTLHRVVVHEKERYSVAFFLDPNFDCLVDCLPACCSDTNPPKFPPITSGEYLLERYFSAYKSMCLKL